MAVSNASLCAQTSQLGSAAASINSGGTGSPGQPQLHRLIIHRIRHTHDFSRGIGRVLVRADLLQADRAPGLDVAMQNVRNGDAGTLTTGNLRNRDSWCMLKCTFIWPYICCAAGTAWWSGPALHAAPVLLSALVEYRRSRAAGRRRDRRRKLGSGVEFALDACSGGGLSRSSPIGGRFIRYQHTAPRPHLAGPQPRLS